MKITSFTQLIAWRKAHTLVLFIYKITRNFSKEERFGLVSQMRRAAVSISSNIAEGFSRRSKREKEQFYTVSKTSNLELQNQLIISRDLGFIDKTVFKQGAKLSIEVGKLVGGLIKSSTPKY
jgi:four helix bundle protein